MKTVKDEIYEHLVDIISGELGIPRDKVSPCSELFRDLNIYGDDAWDLLNAYSEKFKVDVSGVSFGKYFPSEGEVLVFWFPALKRKYKSLTINHLSVIAKTKVFPSEW